MQSAGRHARLYGRRGRLPPHRRHLSISRRSIITVLMKADYRFVPFLLVCFAGLTFGTALSQAKPGVDVILWFDTEDYLLPADDDACLRLAKMLSERHIRATFKVVGEKARVLEKRGRRDVIAALKQHDIGFHANYHSVHPTPSEYL